MSKCVSDWQVARLGLLANGVEHGVEKFPFKRLEGLSSGDESKKAILNFILSAARYHLDIGKNLASLLEIADVLDKLIEVYLPAALWIASLDGQSEESQLRWVLFDYALEGVVDYY